MAKSKNVVVLKVVYNAEKDNFKMTRRDLVGELIQEEEFSIFRHIRERLVELWGKGKDLI